MAAATDGCCYRWLLLRVTVTDVMRRPMRRVMARHVMGGGLSRMMTQRMMPRMRDVVARDVQRVMTRRVMACRVMAHVVRHMMAHRMVRAHSGCSTPLRTS